MNSRPENQSCATHQTGMALLFCLLFLTALTLLGLSASADAVLQSQLALNLRETERANQSAFATLLWAEKWLLELQGPAPDTCPLPCDGLKLHPAGSLAADPELEDLSWWQTQGHEAGIDPYTGSRLEFFTSSNGSPPMWVVEASHEEVLSEDGTADTQTWYRVIVRSGGQTGSTIAVLESTITRPWPGGQGSGHDSGRVSWRNLR